MAKQTNWREDPGLTSYTEYKRKFALWPVKSSADQTLWFKYYYSMHRIWTHSYSQEMPYLHADFVENITEDEYIIRKLSGKL